MTVLQSRKDAKELGLKTFYSKHPCPEGHGGERYVSSHICVECGPIRSKKWRESCRENGHIPRLRSSLRKEAQDAGEITYFTGKPCKNGHTSPRYVNSNVCSSCAKERHKEWRDSAYESGKIWTDMGLPAPVRPHPENCEACGRNRGEKRLCLDHDHTTQKFRGWLCNACNRGIGYLGDDLKGIMSAMRYLQKNGNGELH